jgi:hypothetical protein
MGGQPPEGMGVMERYGVSRNGVERVGCERGILEPVGIGGVCDDRVNRESRAEARVVFFENNMDWCSDVAGYRCGILGRQAGSQP